jgi:RNA polymerase sigma factor (sigma-70 family)
MAPPQPSDADDVCSARGGDCDAFGRLFDRHAPLVRSVVAAIARDFDAVDDLTQETFLRAYRGLGGLKDAARFGDWIRGIARMTARERRRQLARTRLRRGDEDVRLVADDGTNEAVERDEQARRVTAAVAALPERERLAVHAYYFHDRNVDEASAALGLSRSGFYAALQRGVSRLRQRLADAAPPSLGARTER